MCGEQQGLRARNAATRLGMRRVRHFYTSNTPYMNTSTKQNDKAYAPHEEVCGLGGDTPRDCVSAASAHNQRAPEARVSTGVLEHHDAVAAAHEALHLHNVLACVRQPSRYVGDLVHVKLRDCALLSWLYVYPMLAPTLASVMARREHGTEVQRKEACYLR
jgi:hypothetical protein